MTNMQEALEMSIFDPNGETSDPDLKNHLRILKEQAKKDKEE